MDTAHANPALVPGRRARRPLGIALIGAIVTVAALGAFLWSTDSARASGCTINWVGDLDADWNKTVVVDDVIVDTNWSNNLLPTTSDHVCLNNLGGPYTVNLGAAATVSHYSIESQATLAINGGAFRALANSTNAGTIRLTNGGAELRTEDGTTGTTETLTNTVAGTISFPAGGSAGQRYIGGDLLNFGAVSVANPEATFAPRAESRKPRLTNRGTVTVASGGDLKILNANLRQGSGGTINGPGPVDLSSEGPFSNFSVLEIAGGTIDPGADVNLTCCGFNRVSFVTGSASATGNIDVQAGDHPITGNVPAGISIEIEGGGRLNSRTDYTNAGTITLNGADAEIRTANGNNADTEKLTNTGTIVYTGSTGTEYIGGNLLNQGTITVDHPDATFAPRGESRKPRLTNAATVNVASGRQLEILNANLRQASGGTINGPGPVNVSSEGPFSNFSVLEIAGGTIAPGADVNLICCGFNTVSFVAGSASATGNIDVQAGDHPITGNVPAGISLDIEGAGRLNSQTDYTNAGTITLNGADAEIRTANGNTADTETLTNTGTIVYTGSTGSEYIGGDLLNQGTITVDHPDATFAPRGESRKPRLTNAGTVTVASGDQLEILNAILRQAGGGTINGPGPVNVSSEGPFSNFSVLEIAGGAIAPSADVNLTCCGFNAVSFVAGSAGATGNIDVQFAQHPITGDIPAGISIDIESGGRLEAQADYTNAGTITLTGDGAEIRTENGNNANAETLTNTGTIAYAGTGGTEYIGGDLLNQGTISVSHPDAHFQQRSESRPPKLTNAGGGTLTVAAADQLSGVAGSTQAFENAGTVQVSGALTMPGYTQTAGTTSLVGGPPAAVSVSGPGVLALQGGTLKGAGTVGPDVNNTGGTVAPGASPGILSIASDYTQSAGGTLAVEVNGPAAGTGYDQLQVGDEVSLAGTLTVDTSGFSPAVDQVFTIVDAPAPPAAPNVTGTFDTVQETGHDYDTIYNPTNVVLRANGWTNPLTLSGAGQSVTDPQVAVDADGDAVFAWARSDGTNQRIEARGRSAAGALGAVQSISAAGQDASSPRVAIADDGDAVFVWARSDGTDQRIQARARSAAGVLGPVQTLSPAGRNAFQPEVAIDDDGDAVFAWRLFDGTNQVIQGRVRSAAGAVGALLSLSAAGQNAFNPQVAIDDDGDAVFTWERSDGVNQRVEARARAAGGSLSAVQLLSAAGRDAGAPQVAIDDDGDAVFTWERSDGTNQRIQARARSAAGVLGAIENLSGPGENASVPQVAVDADGDAVFTWERSDGTNQRIQARARSAIGALSGVQTLSVAGQDAEAPQVAVDADGDAVFVWERVDNSGNERIQAQTRSAAGALGVVQTLSVAGRDAHFAQVAIDDDGEAAATWQRFDGANDRAQAAFGP